MRNKSFFPMIVCGVLLSLLGGLCHVHGQSKPTLLFKHLNMGGGLSDPSVRTFYQDKHGFLWIGTENGLTRFDGTSTRVYKHHPDDSTSISGDMITNIIADKAGNLLIGTQKALSQYNYAQDRFRTFRFKELPDPERNHYSFPFFIDDKQQVWVFIAGRVYVYSTQKVALTYVTDYSNGHSYVNQPFFTPLNHFVSRGSKGIYINELTGDKSKRVRQYFTNDPEACGPVSQIGQVQFDGDSLLWLAGDSGLFMLNPRNHNYIQYDRYAGKKGLFATSVVAYPNKPWLLVGTIGEGVLLFDKISRKFIGQYKHVSNDQLSLSGNSVSTLYVTRDGNLFIGVGSAGVDYTNLDRVQFDRYFTKEDANRLHVENSVIALFLDKQGAIWCGTNASGILIYDSHMVRPPRMVLPGLGVARILALSNDEVLVCLINGSYLRYVYSQRRFHKMTVQSSIKGAGSDAVNQFIQMPDSSWIVGTESGLARVRRPNPDELYFDLDSSANKSMMWPNVQQIIPLKKPWALVQTYYTNLYQYTYNSGKFSMVRELCETPFYINGSILQNPSLYLATSSGLLRFDTGRMQLDGEPLIPAYCTGVLSDNQGNIWVSSSNGLYVYFPKKKTYKHYTTSDGLQDMSFINGSLAKFVDGRIIGGGPNGVNLFHPERIKDFAVPFQIKITHISVNDRPYEVVGNPVLNPELILSNDQNTISMTFTPVDYVDPERQAITYQMLPYDASAVTVIGKHEIRYPKMPPGKYRFEVASVSSGQKTAISIVIRPPYWKTWWFVSASILLLGLFVFFGIKLYVSWITNVQRLRLRLMMRSQEEERKRIARDLHDDFGARLSALKLYMQAAGKTKTETALSMQQQSAQFIDQVIAELRNILLNLSPKALEENGLVDALQELADNINKLHIITMYLDADTFNVRLKNTCEYAMFRVCQELVNNTIKHAQAKNIYLSLVSRKDEVVLLFEDDGRGFHTGNITRGYGLKNIETHVQAVKGLLTIDSSPGRGLAVTIRLPSNSIERHRKFNK